VIHLRLQSFEFVQTPHHVSAFLPKHGEEKTFDAMLRFSCCLFFSLCQGQDDSVMDPPEWRSELAVQSAKKTMRTLQGDKIN
jgi:hypothetical protein